MDQFCLIYDVFYLIGLKMADHMPVNVIRKGFILFRKLLDFIFSEYSDAYIICLLKYCNGFGLADRDQSHFTCLLCTSLTLLYALHGLKRFYPKQFELSAVTVDLGFENFDLTPIKELCRELEVPYHIVDSEIYHMLFDVLKEANPCSLLSLIHI